MRIGIDIRTILSPYKNDEIGVGHYILQLVKSLHSQYKNDEFVLFHDHRLREKDWHYFKKIGIELRTFPFVRAARFLPGLYNEVMVSHVFSQAKLDVLHMPLSSMRIPVSYVGPVVVTVHDLGIYKSPESYGRFHAARLRATQILTLKKATHIIAQSKTMRVNLMRTFALPKECISVVLPGVDKRFLEPKVDMERKVARSYGANKKYILFVGTLHHIKNITRLLHAFSIFGNKRRALSEREQSDYQLLLVGKSGTAGEEITSFVQDLDVEGDIKSTGYVSGDDLRALYQHASMVVQPALYDGTGTTVNEAFSVGVPVIASRVGVLSEVSDEAAILVDPHDTHAFADAFSSLATDKNLRAQCVEKGHVRIAGLSWSQTARDTYAIYNRCVK